MSVKGVAGDRGHSYAAYVQEETTPRKAARVILGPAMRRARGDMTQVALADAVGVDQPTVSRWERDEQRPSLEQIAAVETAARRRRGFILVSAGSVECAQSVENALA